jgi:large subunit ribosomal protein L20
MRVKSIASRKHRKIRAAAKGYRHARRRRIGAAIEAVMHAGHYAYVGRRLRKRDMRALWITRISAAVKSLGSSYSVFIKGLKNANIELDRKVLADIAARDGATFKAIFEKIK